MNSQRRQRRRSLRNATIVLAIFASFSQILLVDAAARVTSAQIA